MRHGEVIGVVPLLEPFEARRLRVGPGLMVEFPIAPHYAPLAYLLVLSTLLLSSHDPIFSSERAPARACQHKLLEQGDEGSETSLEDIFFSFVSHFRRISAPVFVRQVCSSITCEL